MNVYTVVEFYVVEGVCGINFEAYSYSKEIGILLNPNDNSICVVNKTMLSLRHSRSYKRIRKTYRKQYKYLYNILKEGLNNYFTLEEMHKESFKLLLGVDSLLVNSNRTALLQFLNSLTEEYVEDKIDNAVISYMARHCR